MAISVRRAETGTARGVRARTRHRFGPSLRKLVLTVHILASVGLLGLSGGMLLLGLAAAGSGDASTSQSALVAMSLFARGFVPAVAMSALVSGIVISVGTPWGLFTHNWVVAKLALTVASILSGIFVVGPSVARASAAVAGSAGDIAARPDIPASLIPALALNVLMLGLATALSVYKPAGKLRRQSDEAPRS